MYKDLEVDSEEVTEEKLEEAEAQCDHPQECHYNVHMHYKTHQTEEHRSARMSRSADEAEKPVWAWYKAFDQQHQEMGPELPCRRQ